MLHPWSFSFCVLCVVVPATSRERVDDNWFLKTAVSPVAKIVFEWNIENFSFLPQAPSQYVESPEFYSDRDPCRKWRLQLYPRGKREYKYVALFLVFTTNDEEKKSAHAKLKVKTVDERGVVQKEYVRGVSSYQSDNPIGSDYFMVGSELCSDHSGRWCNIPNDTLKLLCELEVLVDQKNGSSGLELQSNKFVVVPSNVHSSRLSDDLLRLLESGQAADVTFVVGKDHEFKAHQAILTARSPVFAAMVGSLHRVEIPDVSPEVFRQLLVFIYGARLPEVVTKDFLIAADKFYLPNLEDVDVELDQETPTCS